MVRPWEPRALVLATYANDGMYGYGPDEVMINISKLLHWARTDFPGIKLFIVEDHPRPNSRDYNRKEMWNSNRIKRERFLEMIHAYAASHEDTAVIRLWDKPQFFETPEDVGNYKKVREDIFMADKVHPNQAGYDILKDIFTEALSDLL